MVARFIAGKDLAGVLYYNEDKVEHGMAHCLAAVGYGCPASELTVREKIARLQELTSRNQMTRTNAVHISLNFDPEERLDEQTLLAIAASYINQVGFGGQPYMVYQHFDAAHPHIHIATTNIRKDGSRIPLHNIGEQYSEPARKAIEKEYGLIPAESKKQDNIFTLKPVDLQVVEYGKQPTKAAISNVVRSVVRGYRFTSLAELNAVLNQFNVLADGGEPGSRMHTQGGLVYCLIDKQGQKVGIPIKSSSIYEEPTLKNLQKRFAVNIGLRKPYKERLLRIVEGLLQAGIDREDFERRLQEKGIHVVWRKNAEGHEYGITFVDHRTRTVFNGSDLGKGYGLKGITARLVSWTHPDYLRNQAAVERILAATDFSAGFLSVLQGWQSAGLRIHVITDSDGFTRYHLGMAGTTTATFVPANAKLSAYLNVHQVHNKMRVQPEGGGGADRLPNSAALPAIPGIGSAPARELQHMLHHIVTVTYVDDYLPPELLKEARKKKQRKRKS